MRKVLLKVLLMVVLLEIVEYTQTLDIVYGYKSQWIKHEVKRGQTLVIAPRKVGPGAWRIRSYDASKLSLLEDIKEPFQSYIFKALEGSRTEVVLEYEYDKAREHERHEIVISGAGDEKRVQRIEERKDRGKVSNREGSGAQKGGGYFLNDDKAHYNYIKNLYKLGLNKAAYKNIKYYKSNYKLSKLLVEVYLLEAEVLIRLKRYEEAIRLYEKILEREEKLNDKVTLLFRLGKLYKDNLNYEKAKRTYANILTLTKALEEKQRANVLLGKISFAEGNYKEAIKHFEGLLLEKGFGEAEDAGGYKLKEVVLYMLFQCYYKKASVKDYYNSYKYLLMLYKEYPHGVYTKVTKAQRKYLEENFVNYY